MSKITKSQLIEGFRLIGLYTDNTEAKALCDYYVEAFKENPRNVSREDLQDAMSLISEYCGNKDFGLLLEEATKSAKTSKVASKKDAKENSQASDIKPDKKENKKIKKTSKNKKDKSEVIVLNRDEIFPKKVESATLGNVLERLDDIKSVGDLVELIEKDEDIIIAVYWNKQQLKQYGSGYDPLHINPQGVPKSFENDLDLIEVTFANELVVTGCSLYSYVPNIMVPDHFIPDENTGFMYANGAEMCIYKVGEDLAEEENEEEEEDEE